MVVFRCYDVGETTIIKLSKIGAKNFHVFRYMDDVKSNFIRTVQLK